MRLTKWYAESRPACDIVEEVDKTNLEQAKQWYAGQWLAFLVTEETRTGELWDQLFAHNPDWGELREKKEERAYITFAGPVVKPGTR